MRHTNTFRICETDRLVMFRATPRPALYALLNGAAYFPVSLRAYDPSGLADWLVSEEITVYRGAVSAFRSFAGGLGPVIFRHLRLILLFGEPAYHTDAELYAKHCTDDAILGISLGCNEFDDYACYFLNKNTLPPRGAIPAGYPIADTEVLIVDGAGRPVDVDQVGEIVIRSPYNAVGYWRRPDLTTAAFAPDPEGSNGCRLYHTGDLGRRQANGCLYHHGRKDFQVKIRGYRVELSEVEAALLEIDGVKEAVVVGRERNPGEKRLVGYIILGDTPRPRISELRRQLGEKLPDYMVPSSFVFLEAFPLTANGKVDRRALPAPDGTRPTMDSSFVAPRTVVEEEVAAIWAEALGLDGVGVHDGFLELGGDSLLAMQVISQVLARWRLQIPLGVLLDAPTVAAMAEQIDSIGTEPEQLDGLPVLRKLR
jgi:acyl-coenzyme A synthetase/AMP-(fatty) acid ligase/acyl carrier protein